jgi:elongation factor Ts
MANITAADVNALRKKTGAGMMDCKKALVEADGDIEKAIDILRTKGAAKAAKRGDREASEGYVIAKATEDGKLGAVLVLNCETDFVAKNEDFGKLASTILDLAIENQPSSVEELNALSFAGNGLTVGDKVLEQSGVIGEKLEISSYGTVNSERVIAYNHPGNRLATVVGLSKDVDNSGEIGKDIAMQVAAMNPIALNKDGISQETIDRELEVGKEQAIQEGKPAEMAEKISFGRLNKFFKENTLLAQQYIKDNKKSVEQFLKENDSELTVTEFKRISLGE